jgi:hypothetical protein
MVFSKITSLITSCHLPEGALKNHRKYLARIADTLAVIQNSRIKVKTHNC